MSNELQLNQMVMTADSALPQAVDTIVGDKLIGGLGSFLDRKFAEWRGQMSEDMAGIKQGFADAKAKMSDGITNLKSSIPMLAPSKSVEISAPALALAPELSGPPTAATQPITANLSQKDLQSVEDLKSKFAFTAVDFGQQQQEVSSQAVSNHAQFQQKQQGGMAIA
jgi:hypothetical protein